MDESLAGVPGQTAALPESVRLLQQRLGYAFNDPRAALQALTHRSHSQAHNERLEFLGDGVLNLVVAYWLFQHHPELDEGALSRLRSTLVNRQALLQCAQALELYPLLRLGAGERQGGAAMGSILADTLEAVIGAVFHDGGFAAASRIVPVLLGPVLEHGLVKDVPKDPKTRLQEWLQARRHPLPQYLLMATRGVAHDHTFQVCCQLEHPPLRSSAEGKSRRDAEQRAASGVLQQLEGLL